MDVNIAKAYFSRLLNVNRRQMRASNINAAVDAWWFSIPESAFIQDLYLILIGEYNTKLLGIPANTLNLNLFYGRVLCGRDVIELSISSDANDHNYMHNTVGNNHNFADHILLPHDNVPNENILNG